MTRAVYVDKELWKLLKDLHPDRIWREGCTITCVCRCRCDHALSCHRRLTRGTLECRLCSCAEHNPAQHEPSCVWPALAERAPMRPWHWLSEREAASRQRTGWQDEREADLQVQPHILRP